MTYIPSLQEIEHYKIDDIKLCMILEKLMQQMNIINYKIHKIETDASKRYYYRIFSTYKTYIFMDSRLETDSFKNFVKIDSFLIRNSIRVPIIHAKDDIHSVMVLEDFGDISFNNYLKLYPNQESQLYKIAIQKLQTLHSIDLDINLPYQTEDFLDKGLHTFIEWYVMKNFNELDSDYISRGLISIFHMLYPILAKLKRVMVLRDFHADNLMYITNNDKPDLGLLDFQDAVIGSPIYDLVSLLEDVRRNLNDQMVEELKTDFFMHLNQPFDELEKVYSILAVQRSLRIIGTFHRLSIRDNKPKYLMFLPKVWQNLRANLEHPIFASLKMIFKQYNI